MLKFFPFDEQMLILYVKLQCFLSICVNYVCLSWLNNVL
jgi:hypothetical protein